MENNNIETNINIVKGNKNKKFNFKYLVNKEKEEIYLFGEEFVKNNKDKSYLIIDNIDCELRSKYTFLRKGEQIVTLVIKDNNINFKHLFHFSIEFDQVCCLGLNIFDSDDDEYDLKYKRINNLIDISSLENLDVSECEDLSFMFFGCVNVKNFDCLKNWDISKCKNLRGIFGYCSFSNVNFLSFWKFYNAINLRSMFYYCYELNDIKGCKEWNVEKVEDFRFMFSNCKSLTDVNDLQNWNMQNAKYIGNMFSYCVNLNNINSLFKWKLNNKVNKDYIFLGCINLVNIPSIFEETGSCEIY